MNLFLLILLGCMFVVVFLLIWQFPTHNDQAYQLVATQVQMFVENDNSRTRMAHLRPCEPWERHTTILIKTLLRPKCLLRLLQSIRARYLHVPIIVIDETDPYHDPPAISQAHQSITYAYLPHDSGVSAGRNYGVALARTLFILLLDDDFVFTDQTRIGDMFEFLQERSDYSIVCGALSDRGLYSGSFQYTPNHSVKMVEIPGNPRHGKNVVKKQLTPNIFETDRGLNFFLARRDVLQQVPWDADLKTEEHTEHFFRLFLAGIKVAIHSKVAIFHDGGQTCAVQGPLNQNYTQFRKRTFTNFILSKYNLVEFCGDTSSPLQCIFRRVLEALPKAIPFQLTYGTALGLYRERGMIEWDHDIDLFLDHAFFKDTPDAVNMLQRHMHAASFELVRQFGQLDDGFELTFQHRGSGMLVDVFVLYQHANFCWCASYQNERQIRWKYPHFQPDQLTYFGKAYAIVPRALLVYMYGANWTVPRQQTYDEYVAEATGILWKDESPVPVPSDTFVQDFFGRNVFVINLKSRPEKLQRSHAELSRIGVQFQVFDAIVGQNVCPPQLTAGEVGCSQSHQQLWRDFLAHGDTEWALIFEDDIYIPKNVTQAHFAYAMLEATAGKRRPEIVYFGHCFAHGTLAPQNVYGGNSIRVSLGDASCNHAYAISKRFVRNILPLLDTCRAPIDTQLQEYASQDRSRAACVMFYDYTPEEQVNQALYGEGMVLQARVSESDVADRTTDRSRGRGKIFGSLFT